MLIPWDCMFLKCTRYTRHTHHWYTCTFLRGIILTTTTTTIQQSPPAHGISLSLLHHYVHVIALNSFLSGFWQTSWKLLKLIRIVWIYKLFICKLHKFSDIHWARPQNHNRISRPSFLLQREDVYSTTTLLFILYKRNNCAIQQQEVLHCQVTWPNP